MALLQPQYNKRFPGHCVSLLPGFGRVPPCEAYARELAAVASSQILSCEGVLFMRQFVFLCLCLIFVAIAGWAVSQPTPLLE